MLSPAQKFMLLRKKKTGYSPFDLPSTTYLDARIGSSITIGTGVSQWTSQSGNVNYTEGTGSAQPAYNLTGLDGNPAVVFDGVNDRLIATRTCGVFTRIFLVKTAGIGFLFGSANVYLWTGNGSTFEVSRGAGLISGKNIAGGWLNNNKAKIVIWRFDGTHAGHQVLVNGIVKTATTNGGNNANPGTGTVSATVGIMTRGVTGTGYLNGALSYFRDFDFVLTQDQIDNEVKFILKNFLPTALLNSSGLPILDANQDLTY